MEATIGRKEYESDQKALWVEIHRIGEIIEGPPHPGLEKRMDTFLTKFETLDEERKSQHRANRRRLDMIISILLLVGTYLMFFKH
jgi:hypothetical protein